MNGLFKYLFLVQLSVQLLSVVSYTVVLKQVKSSRPSVKVYRYELRPPKLPPESNPHYVYPKAVLGQRIYPVPPKAGKDGYWNLRAPFKKEKGKYGKGGEKPGSRDPRLLGLPLHLVPPVSNQIEENLEAKEQEEEEVRVVATPFPEKSFSSFGQEKGRVYGNPGEWATPVPPVHADNTTKSEFTPSQLYLQIRHKNTVIHVPQSEALKDAETLEELINAPRLKELARTTHVQETYSEEGYEDAGYDHAGHIRQAQHGQVYDAKDEGRFRIKDPPVIIDYDSDLEESKSVPSRNLSGVAEDAGGENLSNKLEPRITRSRSEVSKTSVEYAKTPKNYKGEHIYSSRVKGPPRDFDGSGHPFDSTATKEVTFPTYFGEMPPTPDGGLSNDSFLYYDPPTKQTSKYSTKIYPVTEPSSSGAKGYPDFKPFISAIDAQASPSAKSLKYSRIYSKKTKQLRLEPYSNEGIYPPPPPPPSVDPETPPREDLPAPGAGERTAEDESAEQRIVLPTIGYINSLTTAHFGQSSPGPSREESDKRLTDALNLTQALDYLRSKKKEKDLESGKSSAEVDVRTFEPMKLKKIRGPFRSSINKAKREVYLMRGRDRRLEKEREDYEGNDESDEPHDEKNEEIAEDERKRIEDENLEKEKYEAELREEISRQEKEILKETYKEIGVEEDISEVFPELELPEPESSQSEETAPTPVNTGKYPFYLSKKLPENSALRYATDPKQFPKKSGHKMEFYESREGVIQCPDFHPDLGDLPNSNSSEPSEERPEENQRIGGLGDKIACLRMKYFDPEPFDNPIFKEREIDYVGKPKDLKKLQTRGKPKIPGESNADQEETTRRRSNFRANKQPKLEIEFPARNRVIPQETKSIADTVPRATSSAHLRPRAHETESPRIIPVTEAVKDVPPHPAATFSNPVVWWRTIYHSDRFPRGHSRYAKSPQRPHTPHYLKTPPKHLVVPHNCLNNVSSLSVLDGTENLTVECSDATLIQEIVRNVARLRIIPKKASEEKMGKKNSVPFEESDWIPILGYPTRKRSSKVQRPVSRRTDRVGKLKSETGQNASSNHYVIDELKEEENVRKGEVMDDMEHYMKLFEELKAMPEEAGTEKETEKGKESASRKRREAQNGPAKSARAAETAEDEGVGTRDISRLSEVKRPLARLSGRDFLVRYHRNKGRHTTEKTEDFWKVPNIQKPLRKHTETAKPFGATEATAKEVELKSGRDSQRTNSSGEKSGKFKIKNAGKNSGASLISEITTKSPEVSAVELWKITANPLNLSKIITKVSRQMSQSTEKPRVVRKHKKVTQTPITEKVEAGTSPAKPEVTQYKTSDQKSNFPSKESAHLNRSTDVIEGPVLYYVVNLKSGRGRWITRYEKRRGGGAVKYRRS